MLPRIRFKVPSVLRQISLNVYCRLCGDSGLASFSLPFFLPVKGLLPALSSLGWGWLWVGGPGLGPPMWFWEFCLKLLWSFCDHTLSPTWREIISGFCHNCPNNWFLIYCRLSFSVWCRSKNLGFGVLWQLFGQGCEQVSFIHITVQKAVINTGNECRTERHLKKS